MAATGAPEVDLEDKSLVLMGNVHLEKKCSVVLDKDVFDRWCVVGIMEGLSSDTSIARFLIQQYEKMRSGIQQQIGHCVQCSCPVGSLCVKCLQQSVSSATGQKSAAGADNEDGTDDVGVHFVPVGISFHSTKESNLSVDPLVHSTTSTVYNTGGSMHEGVNHALSTNFQMSNVHFQMPAMNVQAPDGDGQAQDSANSKPKSAKNKKRKKRKRRSSEDEPPTAKKRKKGKGKKSAEGEPKEARGINPTDHTCEICFATFIRRFQLASHMTKHGIKTPHQCKMCPSAFETYDELQTHDLEAHGGAKKFYDCSVCGALFKARNRMNEHMRRHSGEKPYLCEFCGKGFVTGADRNVHRRFHTGERPYQCSDCGKTYATANALYLHKRTHQADKLLHCPECKRSFTSQCYLAEHMKIHTGLKPYHCQLCGKAVSHKSALTLHMREHFGQTGETPYSCPVCGKTFRTTSAMTSHMRRMKHESIINQQVTLAPAQSTSSIYVST